MKKNSIIFIIAKKEFSEALRDRSLWVFAIITWALIALGAFAGFQRHRTQDIQHTKASLLFRHEWEEQEANPHSAAHFGTYLFKRSSPLSIYDQGLNNFLGNTYRVEAHVQHDVNHSTAEHADTTLRFGELSVSMVFQVLFPLMILLISFNAVSKERETGTLKILLMQGGHPSRIIWGKLLGIYGLVLTVALPALLLLSVPLIMTTAGSALVTRYLIFSFVYLLYFFLFCAAGILLSSINRSSQTALTTALGLWILLTILLPRATTRWIDQSYRLPSRYDFSREAGKAYQQGMNGDGNVSERWNKYMKETLAKYKVDSLSQLPVNFDGLSMQYGEDYNAKVYEHFSRRIEALINTQQLRLEQFSLLNPFQAVQQLSMGLSGTDYDHHLAFHHQATAYRNEFIRELNMSLANSGSAYLSYEFKVGPAFFKNMKEFHYVAPSLGDSIKVHWWSLLSLLCWTVLLLAFFIPLSIRHLKLQ